MKKTSIHSLFFALVLLFAQGCEKQLLDKEPLDMISDAIVWDDPALCNAYLAQLYANTPLQGMFATNPDAAEDNLNVYGQMVSAGEGVCTLPWDVPIIPQGLMSSTQLSMDYYNYGIIRDINIFLVNIKNGKNSDEIKTQYSAQARFLRAYNYFEMVKRYGGVPIVLEPLALTADSAQLFVKRNKEQEVYDLIAKECDEISAVLPETDVPGRVTKYAALALKSRAMLFAASIAKYGTVQLDGLVGIPSSDANKYWQASLDASKAIMDAGQFELFNKYPGNYAYNYQQIFLEKDHKEVILAKKYLDINYAHSWDDWANTFGNATFWGVSFSPCAQMVDSYDWKDGSDGKIDWAHLEGYLRPIILRKDPRCEASILYNGSPWIGDRDTVALWRGTYDENGVLLETDNARYEGRDVVGLDMVSFQRPVGGFTLRKFTDPTHLKPVPGSSYQDWLTFRYAEILLNYAEASFELNGANSDNLKAINDIRDRAGVAELPAITLEKIRHERRIELAFEGQTYWDLIRWRKAVEELNTNTIAAYAFWHMDRTPNRFEYETAPAENFNRVFKEQHYYMPIGLDRRNNDPNLVENPGY
jgi:hypothetical protein